MERLIFQRTDSAPTTVSCLGQGRMPRWLTAEQAVQLAQLEPLTFAVAEFTSRCERIRSELERQSLDAVLVFRPSSVEYLCGHHTVNPYPQPLLVTQTETRLYVPEVELARALVSSVASHIKVVSMGSVGNRVAEDSLAILAADVMESVGPARKIALEINDLRVPPPILALLVAKGALVGDGHELVERVRLILSPAEIEKMECAAQVTQRGVVAAVRAAGAPDATDSSVAAAVFAALTHEANSTAAIPVVVASGRRAGVPHSTWKNLPLADGTTLVEFAGASDRYHAPVMLTVANRPPTRLEQRLELLAQTVLVTVLEEVRPGRVAGEVANCVATRVGRLGDRDLFHWNFGYTVGLAHPPWTADGADWSIVSSNRDVLRAGMAFHVAPWFRNVGRAAVGLSHTIILEESGPRVLTGHGARIIRV